MRARVLPVLLALIVTAVASADDEKKSALKRGDDLPGPFRPYNVTGKYGERVVKELGGKEKEVEGQFHCLVCDHGLNPVAMVLVRNVDPEKAPEGLVELLKQLNVAVQKNRRTRLGSFAVFVNDDLHDVVTEDEKRFELARKLRDGIDKQAELNQGENLVLALESKKYLSHYPLDDAAAAVVLLYNEHKIIEAVNLSKEQLADKEAVAGVLAKVKAMLAPKR